MNLSTSFSVSDSSIALDRPQPLLAVAVGIVLYNNPPEEISDLVRTLHRALARLAASEAAAEPERATTFSIRLQNNGDTRLDVAQFGPGASLIDSPVNAGFGRAHNALMRAAFSNGAEYYLVLNPDGMLHPDALVEMIAVARRSGNRALVEAAQFPEELPKVFDPLTL